MTWRENLARVRAALDLSDLRSRADPIFYTAALTALDALTAQIEELAGALQEVETLLTNYLVAAKFPAGSDCEEVRDTALAALFPEDSA